MNVMASRRQQAERDPHFAEQAMARELYAYEEQGMLKRHWLPEDGDDTPVRRLVGEWLPEWLADPRGGLRNFVAHKVTGQHITGVAGVSWQ